MNVWASGFITVGPVTSGVFWMELINGMRKCCILLSPDLSLFPKASIGVTFSDNGFIQLFVFPPMFRQFTSNPTHGNTIFSSVVVPHSKRKINWEIIPNVR